MEEETYKHILEKTAKEYEAAFEKLAKAIAESSSSIINAINNSVETKEKIEKEKSLRKSWHVPQKIIMSHQVLDKRPNVPHIRNRL